jgi:RNA polymerase sigma factor (TIGR02999 family)
MGAEGRRTVEKGAAGKITGLLSEWTANRPEAAPELWSEVYRELRQIARAYMRNERPDHTLQTTALVNEAYLRLFQGKAGRWENRKHFFCTMARAMRRVLMDHARECHAQKRGGEWEKLSIEAARLLAGNGTQQLLVLNEALEQLGRMNRRQAQVVEMRFFAGLTVEETAAMLDISPETVKLDWRFAKAWLQRQLRPGGNLDVGG